MLRTSATAPTCLKNRRRGILPRPQHFHHNCTLFLHEPRIIIIILYYRTPHFPRKLVHSQINANGPARCGLTNPQHRRKSGLDMAIQAEP